MSKREKFWVLPCLDSPETRFVIYTEHKQEILVNVKNGEIISYSAALTDAHLDYFNKKILTTKTI
jgi:hypothetical protein